MTHTRPVREALLSMMEAVRSGDMQQARAIGEQCVVPLSLSSAELSLSSKISAGAESTVFRGKWRGQDVAVKKLRISTSADLDRFRSELAILASLRHPAVVPLLGARALPPDYLLVLPLAAGGTLRAALYEAGWRPSWRQVLHVAHQVASGMAHVHEAGVLHRDLKPANILLLDPASSLGAQTCDAHAAAAAGAEAGPAPLPDEQSAERRGLAAPPRVQIADFGLAVRVGGAGAGEDPFGAGAGGHDAASLASNGKPTGGFHKKQMVGTLEYMAPELLMRSAPPSAATDVYAWAVTINEVATGIVPFSDCTKDNPEVHTVLEMGYGRMELAAAVAAEGLRPSLPRACPAGYAALMRACWDLDPAARPSFAQVVAALGALLAEELPAWEAAQRQMAEGGGAIKAAASHHQTVVVDVVMVDAADVPLAASCEHQPGHQEGGQLQEQPSSKGGRAASPSIDIAADARTRAGTHPVNGHGHTNGAPAGPQVSTSAAAASPGSEQQQPLWPFILCTPNPREACRDGNAAVPEGGSSCVDAWMLASVEAAATVSGNGSGGGSGVARRQPFTFTFNGGVFKAQGPRDSMEDRHLLLPDLWGRSVVADPASATASAPTAEQQHTNGAHPAAHQQSLAEQQQEEGKEERRWRESRLAWEKEQQRARAREQQKQGGALWQPPSLDALPAVPLAAVFDGHRGAEAAEFCRARLPAVLRAALAQCTCPAAALQRAFVRLEEDYHAYWRAQRAAHLQLARGPTAFPGATALAAMLDPCPAASPCSPSSSSSPSFASSSFSLPSTTAAGAEGVAGAQGGAGPVLYVANAGDCRAALVRRRTALPASRDHTGLLADERARLAAAGVDVTWQHGGWRVGATGLQVTRCIGDFDVKPGAPASSTSLPPRGVSAVPEVTAIPLTPDDLMLILASDGLWDVVGLQEAAGLVFDTVKDPGLAAKRLACEALMRGSADNVTVVVVFLADVASLERVYDEARGGEAYGITGTAYGSRTRMEKDRVVAATADELRDTY